MSEHRYVLILVSVVLFRCLGVRTCMYQYVYICEWVCMLASVVRVCACVFIDYHPYIIIHSVGM